MATVTIKGKVQGREPGYLLVRFETGFGDPELRVVEGKAVDLEATFELMQKDAQGLTEGQKRLLRAALQ